MTGDQMKLTYDEILLSKEFLEFTSQPSEAIREYWKNILENDMDAQNEFDKALRINDLLISHKNHHYSPSLKENLLRQIVRKIEHEDPSVNKGYLKSFFKIAASLVLIVGLSFLFSLFLNKPKDIIVPALALAYNEIIVPSGEKSQVILPDGTKIWLNSESKLKYPAVFEKGNREVYLEGEAYFDVSKIKKSKFHVNTQGVRIEVLGTIFNVKSYPDEATVETSVVEGKVRVEAGTTKNPLQPIVLLPSERAIYYKIGEKFSTEKSIEKKLPREHTLAQKSSITVGEVNIKNIISWKDHLLVFDNETFEEIGIKMGRWYKIQVLINDELLKKQRFTGKFVNNETFYQVLEAINLTTPINYKYERNELTVSSRYLLLHSKHKKPKL